MNEAIRELEPLALWNYFADLNAIPRPSKKEERVIRFIADFGNNLGLPTFVDSVGNVIIRKPATLGMEQRETVVLQSHLDMVHQKNEGTDFDFLTEGIQMQIEGDWVKAMGTTLGADNGIGVAAIMSLLASKDIPHPAIEALFTIDEETGMTGALSLKGGILSGRFMLNLDTEEDNELTIGCAGGIDVTAFGKYIPVAPQHDTAFRLVLKGLDGGHSGLDIHKGKANANKLMNRFLSYIGKKLAIEIAFLEGGSLRNAIPRESITVITTDASNHHQLIAEVAAFAEVLQKEYHTTDPNLSFTCNSEQLPDSVFPSAFQNDFLRAVYACPNGIYRLSPDIPGLVQTSNNLAKIVAKDGTYSVQCLTRSSVETEKTDLKEAITATFEMIGATIEFGGAYPGWTPLPASPIVSLMSELYQELFQEKPHVNACHAGLECGILGINYPDMQMISFGPNIRGAHSPDEKVQISSVQKFWGYLTEALRRIPNQSDPVTS